MKVLNLYAGLGGNRLYWEDCQVTAVEINTEVALEYAGKFKGDFTYCEDAHKYLLDKYRDFDFIWSSPPCPTHSKMMKATRHDIVDYPDMRLYQEILLLKHFFKGKWVVENVVGYYDPLIPPTAKIGRHYFWSNFTITQIDLPKIKDMSRAKREDMVEYLGMDYEGKIYLNGNHCPVQPLRNCVHPLLGKHIFNLARGIFEDNNKQQLKLL